MGISVKIVNHNGSAVGQKYIPSTNKTYPMLKGLTLLKYT